MKTSTPAALAVLALLPLAFAKESFVRLIPNGANVPDTAAIGHSNGTGASESLNDFGEAFEHADEEWASALCKADSDDDGQTNGQELGDPCCEWSVGGTPRWTDGVSHPGDASKTSNASLWASIDCSSSTTAAASISGNAAAPSTSGHAGVAAAIALAVCSALTTLVTIH